MSWFLDNDFTLVLRGDIAGVFQPGAGLVNHEKAGQLIAALQKFYAETTPEDIEEYNRPKPDLSGCVYLLKHESLYKIGMSRYGGRHRAKQIRTKDRLVSTPQVVFERRVHDMAEEEARLHNLFASKRVKGDWFELSPEDVEYIKSLGGAS